MKKGKFAKKNNEWRALTFVYLVTSVTIMVKRSASIVVRSPMDAIVRLGLKNGMNIFAMRNIANGVGRLNMDEFAFTRRTQFIATGMVRTSASGAARTKMMGIVATVQLDVMRSNVCGAIAS